ncbi:MAG TPA: hypothetical protein P5567_02900 [Kiritimatiellia bacterium]|nr:hypothetical protein [Kiritimatiellia bacterium]HRZ11382.1 hypothetical protein [Kiritimatiellia bacterium]HSA17067.1 hypothetical protein [Kiritimatiellia bacterium]
MKERDYERILASLSPEQHKRLLEIAELDAKVPKQEKKVRRFFKQRAKKREEEIKKLVSLSPKDVLEQCRCWILDFFDDRIIEKQFGVTGIKSAFAPQQKNTHSQSLEDLRQSFCSWLSRLSDRTQWRYFTTLLKYRAIPTEFFIEPFFQYIKELADHPEKAARSAGKAAIVYSMTGRGGSIKGGRLNRLQSSEILGVCLKTFDGMRKQTKCPDSWLGRKETNERVVTYDAEQVYDLTIERLHTSLSVEAEKKREAERNRRE